MLIRPPIRLASTRWPAAVVPRSRASSAARSAEGGVEPGDEVADRRPGAQRLAVRRPFTLMKPLIAWAMKSNAGRST